MKEKFMKKQKLDEKIVCDLTGCGRLSTYRLTFRNGTTVFVCKDCFDEAREFFVKENENDNKKTK